MQAEQNPWQIVDEQLVYDNKFISLTHYNVINPSGNNGIYGKVHFKNIAVGVIPIDSEGNTYLVGQFRFTLNQYSWEIPEGGCPFDEEPLVGAQRELLEETGLISKKWQLLGTAHLSNSVSDEIAIFYLATNLTQAQAQPEDTEQLQIKKVHISKVFEMIQKGEITDALSVLALQKVQLLMLQNKISF